MTKNAILGYLSALVGLMGFVVIFTDRGRFAWVFAAACFGGAMVGDFLSSRFGKSTRKARAVEET